MKSTKKLFAILTLVAFMMTMIPMAAFGAGYTAGGSTLEGINKNPGLAVQADMVNLNTTAKADKYAKMTITFKDGANLVTGENVTFYVKSSRDTEFGWVEVTASTNAATYDNGVDIALTKTAMASEHGQKVMTCPADATGKVSFYIASDVAGAASIKVYKDSAKTGTQIPSTQDITFTPGKGGLTVLLLNPATNNTAAPRGATEDAGTGINIWAELADGGVKLEGKTLTFKQQFKGGNYVTLGTAVTDKDGVAYFNLKPTNAGIYNFKVEAPEDVKDTKRIEIAPKVNGTIKIAPFMIADGAKVANQEKREIKFSVRDEYDNLFKMNADNNATKLILTVKSAPADSALKDKTYNLVSPIPGKNTDADGNVKFEFTPDKVGTYALEAKLDGKVYKSNVSVESVKFGKAVSLSTTIIEKQGPKKPNNSLRFGADERLVELKKKNADGVELKITDNTTAQFAVSNPAAVTIDANGNIKVIDNKFFGDVVITASLGDPDNLVASATGKVVGAPASFSVTPSVTDLTAAVKVQLIDINGNNSWPTAQNPATPKPISVIVPSGVYASEIKDLVNGGFADFKLTADQAGTYSVTVNYVADMVTKTFDITFAAPKVIIGAQSVTMFLGSKGYVADGAAKVSDVAPFIKDDRTFVEVRAIAEAFGATPGWDEATQTVTLTRSDMTITLVIGSPAITGGVAPVTADVPAFIDAASGRTVVPFRAIADAFGATVDYDAATQAVSFVQ